MKAIVIYYSYSGNTKNIALHIAEALNADTAVIDTVKAYEGDYDAVVEQGHDEIRKGFRPPIKPINVDLSQYDTIILGTPVWWYTFAPAVKTFIESYDLSGKTIYPFATNGGWLGHTLKDIAAECNGANVKNGLDLHFNGAKLMADKSNLESWIKNIK